MALPLYAFYQTEKQNPAAVEFALPELLGGWLPRRVLVCCPNAARAERLSDALWTFEPASFLPHGLQGEPHADMQPVLITDQLPTISAKTSTNQADILVLLGQGEALAPLVSLAGFSQVIDMFDASEPQKSLARGRWKALKAEGMEPQYFAETTSGWAQKA